jgi:hypothetical protein
VFCTCYSQFCREPHACISDKYKNQSANHHGAAKRKYTRRVGWGDTHKCPRESNHTCSRDLMYGISGSRVDERQAPGGAKRNSIKIRSDPIRSDP